MSDGKRADKTSPSSLHFAAGLCSGLLSAILLQPADLLKTRLQQSSRAVTRNVKFTASSTSLPTHSKTFLPSPAISTSSSPLAYSASASALATSSIAFSTTRPTLRSNIAEILAQPNPVRELWRGTVASALRTGLGSAMYFTTLNAMRREVAGLPRAGLPDGDGSTIAHDSSSKDTSLKLLDGSTPVQSGSTLPRLSSMANLATGAAARAFAGFLLMPVTVLKVTMESNLHDRAGGGGSRAKNISSKSTASSNRTTTTIPTASKTSTTMRSAASSVYRRHGLRGFFAGTGATVVRDAPYAGLYVVFYEWSKDVLTRATSSTSGLTFVPSVMALTSPTDSFATVSASTPAYAATNNAKTICPPSISSPATITFLSGALAGIIATAVTNPFDVIKTRLQLQPEKYGHMARAVRLMVSEEKEEGARLKAGHRGKSNGGGSVGGRYGNGATMKEGRSLISRLMKERIKGLKSLRCLFDGLALRMARKALSSAIAWTVYEELLRRF